MKPLTTALIDTFNHERYIEQALVSVLEQGLSPSELEIVVVDDGSTDRTPEIIQKFLPRVKYVRKKNGGQASAFNAAFPECSGEIVAFLDGDDWFAKGKLEAVLHALELYPEVSAVGHGYYEFDEETKKAQVCAPPEKTILHLATPDAARAALSGWKFLLLGALTVRRKVMERIMPIPEALVFYADNPFQAAAMAMGALVLETPLSYYRLHAHNLHSIDPENTIKMRRKYEMLDLSWGQVHALLLRLGVPEACVSELLDPYRVYLNRLSLRTFGGSRLKTLQTEMLDLRSAYKNPSLGYRLFKYFVMAPATLALSPRQFYGLRDWYTQKNLARFREWLGETDPMAHDPKIRAPGLKS